MGVDLFDHPSHLFLPFPVLTSFVCTVFSSYFTLTPQFLLMTFEVQTSYLCNCFCCMIARIIYLCLKNKQVTDKPANTHTYKSPRVEPCRCKSQGMYCECSDSYSTSQGITTRGDDEDGGPPVDGINSIIILRVVTAGRLIFINVVSLL